MTGDNLVQPAVDIVSAMQSRGAVAVRDAIPSLRAMIGRRGATEALFASDGTRLPLKFASVKSLPDGFRRMVRSLEFDVCEMAITTYLCARAYGVPITALPIFPFRGFHHGAIWVRRGSAPACIAAGARIGVMRGYTATTGLWARAVLQEEYVIDPSSIAWLVTGDEHVERYRLPTNVQPVADGGSLEAMLLDGDITALIGAGIRHPDIVPLVDDAHAHALSRMEKSGYYPINHVIVMRDDALANYPGAAHELFRAMVDAKRLYAERLASGVALADDEIEQLHARILAMGGDPLPYGIGPNRRMLAALLDHVASQRIIMNKPQLETLFAAGTMDLIG